jgi:digeranylgeranylglycerophospholipid reductase
MRDNCDVVIVGAGPAGSTAAERLSRHGLDVLVVEEHAEVGEPVDCTGVLGAEAFEAFALPRHLVLGAVDAVTLHSPGGIPATHRGRQPLAYAVDRAALDRTLARRAEAAGARIVLRTRALDVIPERQAVRVECQGPEAAPLRVRAQVVILAGGPRFGLQEKLGLGGPPLLWRSAHAELAGDGLQGAQVFLGREVAPGGFGWAVPIRREGMPWVRVGVNALGDAPRYLRRLCAHRFAHLPPPGEAGGYRSWVVPIRPLRRTVGERLLAVGDAAGQVKPTSGGGIYYGMLSACEAADTAAEALRQGTLARGGLQAYERRWRARLGLDLTFGTLFRRLFARMSDPDTDDLFRALLSSGLLGRVTAQVSFDWHRHLIGALLTHPRLAGILLRGSLGWRPPAGGEGGPPA